MDKGGGGDPGQTNDNDDGSDEDSHRGDDRKIQIKIDRQTFKVEKESMTGYELRLLTSPPIGSHDLLRSAAERGLQLPETAAQFVKALSTSVGCHLVKGGSTAVGRPIQDQ